MVVTVEPGYYETGKFGIRIENCYELIAVDPENLPSKATNFITFAPLTFVPIQKSLVVKELLESKHVSFMNLFILQFLIYFWYKLIYSFQTFSCFVLVFIFF